MDVFECLYFDEGLLRTRRQIRKLLRRRLECSEVMFDPYVSRLMTTLARIDEIVGSKGNFGYSLGGQAEGAGVGLEVRMRGEEEGKSTSGRFKAGLKLEFIAGLKIGTIPEMRAELEESPKESEPGSENMRLIRGLKKVEFRLKLNPEMYEIFKKTLVQWVNGSDFEHRFDCREFVKHDLAYGSYFRKEGNFQAFHQYKNEIHLKLEETSSKDSGKKCLPRRFTQISGLRRPLHHNSSFQSQGSHILSELGSEFVSSAKRLKVNSNLSRSESKQTGQSFDVQCTSILEKVMGSTRLRHTPVIRFGDLSKDDNSQDNCLPSDRTASKTVSVFNSRVNSGHKISKARHVQPITPQPSFNSPEMSNFTFSPAVDIRKSEKSDKSDKSDNKTSSSERLIDEVLRSNGAIIKKALCFGSENRRGFVNKKRCKSGFSCPFIEKGHGTMRNKKSRNLESYVISSQFLSRESSFLGGLQTGARAGLQGETRPYGEFSKLGRQANLGDRGGKRKRHLNWTGSSKNLEVIGRQDFKRVISDRRN